MISEEEIALSALKPVQDTHSVSGNTCVLLAEDDKSLRRYLEVVLERAGYEVRPAGDGLEAMKLLLSSRIDIVITDAVMPNLSGTELCRFIRSTPQLAEIPIVFLSALDPKNTGAEVEQVDAFLAKPLCPEDLLQTLTDVGKKRTTKQ